MLKLLVYGYSYGIRSSRKLGRVCHHNLSFVWLTSNLKPDPKTIAEFRRKNKEALAQVLKQCAKICIKLNLIEGNTLFLDGTKIRANASIDKTWTKEKAKKALKHIDERISDILAQCDAIDEAEQGSLVTIDEELKDHIALLTLFKTYQGTNQAQITALVGLDSTKRESGSSVRGRAKISKNGKTIYRKASYLPAIVQLYIIKK